MAKTKSTDIKPSENRTLVEGAWHNAFELAQEARTEIHKHVGALIELVSGALASGGKFAASLNDRANALAGEALSASDRGVRELVNKSRETAAEAAQRATDTAKTIVGAKDAA